MKILFVGVLDKDWSTNLSMQRVLEALGHTVVPFNHRTISDGYDSSNMPFGHFVDRWLDKLASFLRSEQVPFQVGWYYFRKGRDKMNEQLCREVRDNKYDLVLLSKTDTMNYKIIPEINEYCPTWYFFMDPMDQARRINAATYAAPATWSSATFSDVTEHFKKAGANAYWITQGVDTEVFKPKPLPKNYDVVFVGTKTAKRQRYINALEKAGISVTCFGDGWQNPQVFHDELVNIYHKSRIVLNFCRIGAGFSIRVFQIMGTGTFLLSEHCKDLESCFQGGIHLDWFRENIDMIEKVRHYLSNEQEREQIASKGCRIVTKQYSWDEIIKQILSIFSRNKQKKSVTVYKLTESGG